MIESNTSDSAMNQICHQPTDTTNAIYTAFLIIVLMVNLTGNGLVCLVLKSSTLISNRPTYIFLLSLAITDILTGICSFPIRIRQSLDNQLFCMPDWVCWFHFFSDTVLSVSSIVHLLAVTIERYIAIQMPYHYDNIVTHRRAYIAVVMIWLYSALWTGLNVFDWSFPDQPGVIHDQKMAICTTGNKIYFTVLYVFIFLIPIAIMSAVYTVIYRTAAYHIRRMSQNEVHTHTKQRSKVIRQREIKTLTTIIIVFAAFCFCWIPNIGVSLSGFWNLSFWQNLYLRDRNSFIIAFFVSTQILPALHSTVNPFIYVIGNRQFRQACLKVWRRMISNFEVLYESHMKKNRRERHAESLISRLHQWLSPETFV